jgi:hypothetical protein
VGVPDDEQVVGPGRHQGPEQLPLLGVEVLGLVHHDGPVRQRRLLLFEEAAGGPDRLQPLLLATLFEDVQVAFKRLPDAAPLRPAQRPAPARPRNVKVLAQAFDAVGLGHLLPLLPQEAEVELGLVGVPIRLLPAAVQVVAVGDVEAMALAPS